MSLLMPTYLTAIDTAGAVVLPVTWSDKLCQRLSQSTVGRLALRTLREAFEGLPLRLTETVAGEQVFSGAGLGVEPGWYRQRTDTVADGATGFVPGFCLAGPVTGEPVELAYLPGSQRLPADAAAPTEAAVRVVLQPGDVAVLDSRCVRRWSVPESVFRLSVVRTWIEPESDGGELLGPDPLPRAMRFAGLPWAPATSTEQWLFERHERRT